MVPLEPDTDLEALIALAQSEGEAAPLNEAERFVLACGITPGNARIRRFQVLGLYQNWAQDPIPLFNFFHQFNRLFPRHRWGDRRFYLLDPTPFDHTPDTYFKWLAESRERRKQLSSNAKVQHQKKQS